MRSSLSFLIFSCLAVALMFGCLITGAVDIPASEVIKCVFTGDSDNTIYTSIIMEARLPMTICAMLCGMALAVSGLMLQTTFANPLAGPSILGVSTGASLGVAILMLGPAQWLHAIIGSEQATQIGIILGAIIGAMAIILLLLSLSSLVKSTIMLLIAGIMISYLASAFVSWLNFFAPAQGVKSYAVWGMGSFMGVTLGRLPLFAILTGLLCLLSLMFAKPLNALLAGDNYAASLGYNPKRARTLILLFSGLLTAVATAYCGPVGFIGLAVPHIARITFGTSHHSTLLPATMLTGICVGLACALLCILPTSKGVLPLSTVTPIIGIPVILYVILRRNKLYYFN